MGLRRPLAPAPTATGSIRTVPARHRSGAGLGQDRRGAITGQIRHWHWLAACCLLLALMMFSTRPGSLLADTKIDMAINPLGFLRRAAHLWDPAQFGQLQDQAVGYFFPMGPFFVVGKLLAIPGWVVQRLWLTALSVTAFLGLVRLARRLDLGTDGTRIAAGMAYALAPRALTLLGVNSGELLPAMMAPLVLIPLVRLLRHGQDLGRLGRLRAAAQSAAAVALCGGVNAAAVAAVAGLAAIYVLTGDRAWARWRVLALWLPAAALGTCWWSIPLVLLGKYGVSILPYTESAQVTTSVTSLSNSLRGTEDWDAYLVVNGSAWWPVGYQIATGTLPTLLTGLVAGLGLGGLLTRRVPERRFLICAVLAGLLIIGAGYASGLGNPLAASVGQLINGPLAPLRNLHKFDALIRLPLALGLAHVLASVRVPWRKTAAALLAAAAVALVALPATVTGFSQAGAFPAIPSYWTSAADWLTAHAGHQAVLEVPGARFGEYTWGRPLDDVLEPLFSGDWANDQLSTIGSAGNARLLSAIEQQLDAGQGSAGLTQLLASMGVSYLVVRDDLNPFDLYGAWPARIHDALATAPGLTKVATFGSHKVGDKAPDDAVSNVYAPYPPVEIYRVDTVQPVASVAPVAGTIRVFGAPEALLDLGTDGALDGRPVLLNSDARDIPASQYFVTDSLRRKLRNFGEIRIDYSQTLTAADPLSTFEAADDYLEPSWLPDESVAVYHGIANVTASSSAAGIAALPGQSATGGNPFAAVDGDRRTMWESGGLTGPVHQWLQVSFDHPVDPGTIRVAFADSALLGPPVTRVIVRTSAGSVTDTVRTTSKPQSLAVPAGPARWLRITVAAVARFPAPGAQVGISEISVPGVTASRTIMAPAVRLPAGAAESVLLAKAQPQPAGCVRTSLRWVCSPFLATPTEEEYGFDEGFTSAGSRLAAVRGQAIMTSTTLSTRDAWPGKDQPRVTGTSVYTRDPQDAASAAFDGSAATAWVASATDRHPALTIRWPRPRTVRQVTVTVPRGASTLDEVQVFDRAGLIGGGFIGRTPTIKLPRAVRTDQLTLRFSPPSLPLQIAEVRIPGVRPLTASSDARVRLRCGLGPTIRLNGQLVRTRVSGTVADSRYGRPMTFTACAPAAVRAGQNTVTEPATDPTGWDVQSVLIGAGGPVAGGPVAGAAADAPVRTLTWTASVRVLQVTAAQPAYLEVAQNYNPGWVATTNGKTLRPVRLDGWEQAWLLPAGTRGPVTLTYRPDAVYRKALFGGLALLVVILAIAFFPARRRRRRRDLAPAERAPAERALAGAARLARLAGGLAVLACAGLWLGGYPGAALLPVATVIFALAGRLVARDGLGSVAAAACRALYSRWVPAGLVLAAAAAAAAGSLTLAGSALATALTNTGPQVLCLLVVARLAAGLVAGAEGGIPDKRSTDWPENT